jgi:tetratricopeptide (TPR) repeat protein
VSARRSGTRNARALLTHHRLTVAVVLVLGAGGCSTVSSLLHDRDRPDTGPDLASVVAELPDPVPAPKVATPRPDRASVVAAYRAIDRRLPDPAVNQAIGRRLADLAMDEADDRAAAGDTAAYREAIAQYEALLGVAEGDKRADVLYHLARAHDLAGDASATAATLDQLIADHPGHPHVIEARFRRAETAFSASHWEAAERDYAYVVDAGRASPWWLNAVYMSGWARLRAGDPEGALDRYFVVLAQTLGRATDSANRTTFTSPARSTDGEDATDRELTADTLRATTLALTDLEGPKTLASAMADRGRPSWQFTVYEALAAAYLERERFLDGVATWQAFVEAQPLDARAPVAHGNAIAILADAGFPSDVRREQARFVAAYGIRSDFWQVHAPEVREPYLPALRSYLDELAHAGHATAQAEPTKEHYATAARWYEELIETFPADPEVPDYLFLLGELATDAGEAERAVAAYQRVMREFPEHPQAAEAGYAAVLGLGALADRAGAAAAARARHVDAELEFAKQFPADPRAAAVHVAAADGLFAARDYDRAIAEAGGILTARPDLDPGLRRTALTVVGHGQFEVGRFDAAEDAYRQLLATPLDPPVRASVTERLQAAVYRQAEAAERAGTPDAAVAHYLRLADVDPNAELAIKGHYDAVAVLETAERPADAAALLDRFRTRYPDHPLAADAPRRLAALYESVGNGSAAAGAWREVAEAEADPEVRRQALYRAAELALEGGDELAATHDFARYVERHPRPADLQLEALDHLDRLAESAGDFAARNRWLAAKVTLEREMRAESTDPAVLARATALAAAAQFTLAEHARAEFDAVQLVAPLAQSLERKQAALRRALDAFQAAAAYGIAEQVTASTWHIGDLYGSLANALMSSERPAELSPAELEQYELLLEEQAFPFEEEAIALHELNVGRAREGLWDSWIAKSFAELGRLVPARFDRRELDVASLAAPDSGTVDTFASSSGASPPDDTALQAAVTAAPDNCAARTALALHLRHEGAFAEAETHYLACLAARPDFAPAQLNLGILYELYLDRPADALEAYRRYQALTGAPDPRVNGWIQDITRRQGA